MKRPLAIVAAALLVAGCGPGRVVRRGEVNTDLLAKIEREVSAARGLKFTAPVPARTLGPQEMYETLARELAYEYKPGELEMLSSVYARLGLLQPGVALRPVLLRLYEGQVAAFYHPRTKELALATSALGVGGFWVRLFTTLSRRDLVGELLVSHELTHALQDQHYGIPTDPEPLTDSHGDQRLARRALLEGDATLAGFAYIRGALDPETINWIERELHKVPKEFAEQYPDVPEVVRASLAFQYDEGTAFAGWALGAGGWAAVDRVHADPPESTEQVLHPARYYGTRDRPVTITLGGTDALEAAGWTRAYEDTLGELDVRVLAGRFVPADQAVRVADGWGGDRLRALRRGEELILVWLTAWDSPADAAEFAEAMPAIAPDARVERREDRVLVLLAPEGTVGLEALAGAAWRRSRALRPSPKAPGRAGVLATSR